MKDKEDIVNKFVLFWNIKDIKSCMALMTQDVELRSTFAYKLIPASNGLIKGSHTVCNYFEILMERFPEFILTDVELKFLADSIIVKSISPTGKYAFHVQYYIREDNKIYMLKSDTTNI